MLKLDNLQKKTSGNLTEREVTISCHERVFLELMGWLPFVFQSLLIFHFIFNFSIFDSVVLANCNV